MKKVAIALRYWNTISSNSSCVGPSKLSNHFNWGLVGVRKVMLMGDVVYQHMSHKIRLKDLVPLASSPRLLS